MGEPQDVPGECNAHLYIADNYGDNHATMRCQLPKGHPAHHQEGFKRHGKGVLVQWEQDERDAGEQGGGVGMSEIRLDGWKAYCDAFRELFGRNPRDVESISPAALTEMAERMYRDGATSNRVPFPWAEGDLPLKPGGGSKDAE